jgi:hypothetical protein
MNSNLLVSCDDEKYIHVRERTTNISSDESKIRCRKELLFAVDGWFYLIICFHTINDITHKKMQLHSIQTDLTRLIELSKNHGKNSP